MSRLLTILSRVPRPTVPPPTSDPLLMVLSQASLAFATDEGAGAPAAQVVTITSTGTQPAGPINPQVGTVTDPDDIIATAIITGSGPWTLTVTPKEGPSVGVFSASIQITDAAAKATNSPRTVAVQGTVNVAAPPTGSEAATILALIGPTKTVIETAAMGVPFSTYDAVFLQRLPAVSTDSVWTNNYYDRAVAFYARYARTGDPAWLARAHTLVLAYRKDYLEKNNYGSSPHESQMRGLELHFRLTGDELSRTAVAGTYAKALFSYVSTYIGNTQHPHGDNRIQARVLQGALSAYRLGASYGTYTAAGWPARLRENLNKILATQNANGSYSWIQICGGQLNYMVGMLNDVLIEYYRDFEADPRIPDAIERANEYLWTTQWRPADEAFNYASVSCNPNPFGTSVGGMTAAGDLNGLMIASFGWLSQRTGDPKWRTRGDAIMAGLVSARWASRYTGSKQFNQAFAESYRYLAWR